MHDFPYLIAVLPNSVEVRPIEPRIHVQSIDLQKAKTIVTSKRQVPKNPKTILAIVDL